MAVLSANRIFFERIYLLNSKPYTVLKYVITVCILLLEGFIVLPGIVYFVQNIHNLRKATESMYSITAFSLSFGIHGYILTNQSKVFGIFKELQELVEYVSISPQTYKAVDAKTVKFTWNFTIFITGMCSVVLMMPLLIAIVFMVQNDLHDHLFLTFKVTFPFDQKSFDGFLAAFFIELIVGWKFCASFCAINTFFIGVCWYVEVCINNLKQFFRQIDSILRERDWAQHLECNITRSTIRRELVDMVTFHMKILRFVDNFASLMDGVIFLTFSIGTVWLSTCLAQYMDLNPKQMLQTTVSNTLILIWLFVYCFYGQLISSKCAEVGEFAYNSTFYKYPLDLRVFTLLIIARARRPCIITGYKITRCSLESYAGIMNTAISFFMVFRNMDVNA